MTPSNFAFRENLFCVNYTFFTRKIKCCPNLYIFRQMRISFTTGYHLLQDITSNISWAITSFVKIGAAEAMLHARS
jgi:hypothetical protein